MKSRYRTAILGEFIFEDHEAIGSFDGSGFPVLGVTNVSGIIVTGKEASKDLSKYLRLCPRRFAYNPYRINVGSIGLSDIDQEGIVSPAYVVFGTKELLDPKFLFLFLKSREGDRQINYFGNRGSVRGALRYGDLCKIEIPLPPLPDQRRIVARSGELAAKIEEARTFRYQAAEEAEALFLSVLANLRLPSGSMTKPIAECSRMTTGTTPPSHRSDYYEGPIQWYTPGDLEFKQRLGPSSRTLSEVALAERKARIFEPGTVLLVAIGASLGKVALTHERCSANQQITGIKFSEDILPEYGFWWMRRLGRDLMAAAPQATLPIINQVRIGAFEISIPSLSEQRRIVAELDALRAKVDRLKKLQAETAEEFEALLPSVLDRAFKGDL